MPRSNDIQLIGLVGRAGAGKSTAAGLVEGAMILNYAGELKRICYMMGWNGEKDPEGRALLEGVGNLARKCIHANCWVNMLMSKVDQIQGPKTIIIDDVRYPNECRAILYRGGVLIHLERGSLNMFSKVGRWFKYPSERRINESAALCQYHFKNQSREQLKHELEFIIRKMRNS